MIQITPGEMKTDAHTKTCIQMFIAVLLIIDKKWKWRHSNVNQSRMDKQNVIYPYSGIFFS